MPPQGNKITFARPDQWVAGWRDVGEEQALREVLRRFLYAYGPARPGDFRAWFGEVAFELIDVEEVDVQGHRAFVLAGDTEFPEPAKSVRLLPEYEQLLAQIAATRSALRATLEKSLTTTAGDDE